MTYLEKIKKTTQFLKENISFEPKIGVILGTGLGGLVNDIEIIQEFAYNDIPHFPIATIESHSGRLIFGVLEGKQIVCMQGRFHYYEGYDMKEVTFPVRVMRLLGVETLFVSNAAGSTNADIEKGDLVIIDDHINLHLESPLRGPNLDEFGPRFVDLIAPYSQKLGNRAMEIAKEHGFGAHKGVYASVAGPHLETRAEYVYLNRIGADCVGMSTVPEVIVAVHCGIEVFAVSVITDKAIPIEELEPVTIESVIAVALQAEPKMTTIIKELIKDV